MEFRGAHFQIQKSINIQKTLKNASLVGEVLMHLHRSY